MTDHSPTENAPNDSHLFARLWRTYLRKYVWWVILAGILMMIEGSSLGALSYLLEPMFDEVFVAGRADMVVWVGLVIFGLFVMRAFVGVIQRVIMANVSFRASSQLQKDLLTHVLTLDNAFFAKNSPGQLIERVQGDVLGIQNVWTILLMGAGRDLVALISLLFVAISVDPIWTLVAIIGAPLMLLPSFTVQRYIRRKGHTLRDIAARRTTRLDEIFHGITPVKLNTMEAYQNARFASVTDEHIQASVKSHAGHAVVPGLVDLAVGIGFLAVMIYGGGQIIEGEKTIGEFMSFFTAMALAFQPLRRLANIAGFYQLMMASLERIYWLLDQRPSIKDVTNAGPTLETAQIVFNDVSLAYEEAPVLSGLSFTARHGETTALVGLSGAGKSTVFNALTRLADPQSGQITLGGHDIRAWPLAELRAQFSVVTQDTLLFDEALAENVLLGRGDVPEDDLMAALDAAHVTEFLPKLSDGINTPAGPRGSNLSGGQRQRVAIARALLRRAPVLLLDEATSALDAKSEVLVQEALETLSQGRTTLVIAHRLSTVRNADRILVLERGRLVEEGTHDALLAAGGVYAQLNALQSEGNQGDLQDE